MFSFITSKLKKIFTTVTSQLSSFFTKKVIDAAALKELEIILLSSDVGVKTTKSIIQQLQSQVNTTISSGDDLKKELKKILLSLLESPTETTTPSETDVIIFVGINGSGKTTSIGKLAQHYKQQNKKVLLVAADTFRAAASEQLNEWALSCGVDIVCGKEGQDPASVVFQGCEKYKQNGYDILLIDTAGRLHTKINLMNELAKIKRILVKQLPDKKIATLLTIDSMLGQNSFEQAKIFKESTDVTGIILTKMDGTGKGGIVFAIAQELSIPVAYITFGEQKDAIKEFNHEEYVTGLLG